MIIWLCSTHLATPTGTHFCITLQWNLQCIPTLSRKPDDLPTRSPSPVSPHPGVLGLCLLWLPLALMSLFLWIPDLLPASCFLQCLSFVLFLFTLAIPHTQLLCFSKVPPTRVFYCTEQTFLKTQDDCIVKAITSVKNQTTITTTQHQLGSLCDDFSLTVASLSTAQLVSLGFLLLPPFSSTMNLRSWDCTEQSTSHPVYPSDCGHFQSVWNHSANLWHLLWVLFIQAQRTHQSVTVGQFFFSI